VPFPGIKRLGYEVDHTLVSSSEVTNEWNYNSIPSILLRGLGQGEFYLYLYLVLPSIITYCYFKQDFTNQVLINARAVKHILVTNYPTDQIKGEKL